MTLIIETKRLILRSPKFEDVDAVVDGLNDYDTAKNLSGVTHPYTLENAKSFIKMCHKRESEDPQTKYFFFIELKSENKVIGDIDLSINKHGVGGTGSWVHRDYRRRGFMTEAKIAINNFYFNELHGFKMETEVYKENLASQKTQLKMGYKEEGFRPQHCRGGPEKKLFDVYVYGLLKDVWLKKEPELVNSLKEKI